MANFRNGEAERSEFDRSEIYFKEVRLNREALSFDGAKFVKSGVCWCDSRSDASEIDFSRAEFIGSKVSESGSLPSEIHPLWEYHFSGVRVVDEGEPFGDESSVE